jgi:hypothetical protein
MPMVQAASIANSVIGMSSPRSDLFHAIDDGPLP